MHFYGITQPPHVLMSFPCMESYRGRPVWGLLLAIAGLFTLDAASTGTGGSSGYDYLRATADKHTLTASKSYAPHHDYIFPPRVFTELQVLSSAADLSRRLWAPVPSVE
jgi:hypothetical protein